MVLHWLKEMIRRHLSRIDPMLRLIVLAIVLASFVPVREGGRPVAQSVSNCAIFVLFFLNGVRLSRQEVLRGIRHWRFLLPLAGWVFLVMAAAGWGVTHVSAHSLPPLVALGFLYLGTLPSTVQSATAYSSLAGGNVASSVVAAAVLNILGVFLTAPLFSLLAGRSELSLSGDGLLKVVLILLLPFMLGQFAQRWVRDWAGEHRMLVTWTDRSSIAIAVYVAFSGAVVSGIWSKLEAGDWGILLIGVGAMLIFAFGGSWLAGSLLKLERGDHIAFLYAGAQKSIAMGAPLAAVLFKPSVAGLLLLPALVYHLAQLVLSAPLASRLRTQ